MLCRNNVFGIQGKVNTYIAMGAKAVVSYTATVEEDVAKYKKILTKTMRQINKHEFANIGEARAYATTLLAAYA